MDEIFRRTHEACAFCGPCRELAYKLEKEPFQTNSGQNADLREAAIQEKAQM